jgi:hypothetical protein
VAVRPSSGLLFEPAYYDLLLGLKGSVAAGGDHPSFYFRNCGTSAARFTREFVRRAGSADLDQRAAIDRQGDAGYEIGLI